MTFLRRAPDCTALALAWLISACSSESPQNSATGGTSATTGGTSAATGGTNAATGGASVVTGGTSATTGGTSTGGAVANSGGGGVGGTAGTTSGGNAGAAGASTGGNAGAAGNTGAAGSGGVGGTAGSAGSAGATTGGAGGSAGSAGAGGGTGGAPVVACPAAYTGSATRPQLTDASSSCFTIPKYFAQTGTLGALTTDNWDPSAGLPAASTYTPTFTVAADGSGTHTTVQAAITAANTAASATRAYILVKPGTYRELVCVKGTVPITLYGADTDATTVVIAFDNYNGKTVDTTKTNACAVPSGTTYGTSGSSTFFASSNGFQAQNLTISNDFAEGTLTSNIQAVALTAQGDQQVFQNVRVIGNQDTLQVKTPDGTKVSRIYIKGSYIEGDTDFIFGRATAVFDDCTITYVSPRKTNSTHISPSTEAANPYGFLIIKSRIVGDAGMPTGTASLGRSWDDSSATAPNGQAVIRETTINNHIVVAAPWAAAATSSRAFNADTNRLYEYKNTGTGAAP